MGQPLILTVQMNDEAQDFYEDLRRRYFPPERNLIPAHLTLFHHLPDEAHTYEAVGEAARATAVCLLGRPELRSLGRGVAVFFQSDALARLHAGLSSTFQSDLIAQDRQRLRPHIVVQNKVDPETARQTLAVLGAGPLVGARATGLTLWRYLGGPWEHLMDLPLVDAGAS